jgi:hypothetical protein
MFYNMDFTDYELESLFKETSPFLRNNGLSSLSVRNDKDVMLGQ